MKTNKALILLAAIAIGCNGNDNPKPSGGGSGTDDDGTGGLSTTDWLIPSNLVFDGGPGKDGIPALIDPDMKEIGNPDLDYLDDDDLMVVLKSQTQIKAYSHKILDWHEIINDKVGDENIAITYCPLTGTGIGWGREYNGQTTTFGVSGLLYETNLIPYDRLTDSYWSQLFNKCVKGLLVGEIPEFYEVVQMNYGALKTLIPDALVSTNITGFDRGGYGQSPYGNYASINNNFLLFPVTNEDTRLPPKEVVRGVIINNSSSVYRFPESGRELINDEINGKQIIVVTDRTNDLMVSFLSKTIDNVLLNFTLVSDENSSIILEDQLGNKWDVFGSAVEGPNVGEQLEVPYSYMGYWFALVDFYPAIKIYGE